MEEYGTVRETRRMVQEHDFRFKKKFGQNFLIDSNILRNIVRDSGIGPEDIVLEVGPGMGALTRFLSEAADEVVAVEIDDTLIPILEENFAGSNVRILHGDILKMDLDALFGEYAGRRIRVVANLPYYITTPIIMELLEGGYPVDSITIMVQKEVAERMQAGPGSKDYGALSLAVQYYTHPQLLFKVPPSCFMPQPKVESAVIRMDRKEKMLPEAQERLMFQLIRAAFNQRRKTLMNAVTKSGAGGVTKEELSSALNHLGLQETVRGEALKPEEFTALAGEILKGRGE